MPSCPHCQANVLQDAVYCENCGFRLDSVPTGNGETSQHPGRPAHGSLRSEIPLLSGAARQLRARLEGFRERAEREVQSTRREQQVRRQEEESARKSRGRGFAGILVGLALLALWIWLLVRGTGSAPPQQVLQLMQRLAAYELPVD